MANELILARGQLRAKIESTEGTDPTVAAADVKYVENMAIDSFKPDKIKRTGYSPRAAGFKPIHGTERVEWSLDVETQHTTITSGASAGEDEIWFLASGFVKTDNGGATDYEGPGHPLDAANDWIVIYTASDIAPSGQSISLEFTQHQTGDAQGVDHVIRGARCGWSLAIEAGKQWIFSCVDGKGSGANIPAVVSSPTTNTYAASDPVVAKGVDVALIEYAGDTVYGGGTATAPTHTVQILSATFNGNNAPAEDEGISGLCGLARVRNVGAGVTASVVCEYVAPDDFDFYANLRDNDLITLTVARESTETTGNVTEARGSFCIMAIESSEQDDKVILTLELDPCYDEDSADGGGLLPADTFTLSKITKGS